MPVQICLKEAEGSKRWKKRQKDVERGWRGAGRARRGLEDTGTMVISEQTTRRTTQRVGSDCRT